MQTYFKWIDVRVCLALAAGALLLAWTIGCPPPQHPDNFGEGGGGIGDDDDNGDDDDIEDDDVTGDDDDFDNVAACQDLTDSLDCGNYDFEDEMGGCGQFAHFPCDLGGAFMCFEDNFECLEGTPNFAAWVEAGCFDLLTCE